MRKLMFIILLLTSTVCVAQTDPGIEELVGVTGAQVITVKLLMEYEQECYNDSTYVTYYEKNDPFVVTDSVTGMSWVPAIHISPTLVHEWQRKEPTFKDFLVWVRKKYDYDRHN